jgi:small multidrug resistance pump
MLQVYFLLALAILAETAGTTALQASRQFTRFWPSVFVVVAYGFSFYLLAVTLRYMPVGVVYAIWAGLGIVFISAIGYVVFGQKLDTPAVLGMAMIIAGIVVIQLFSKVRRAASGGAAGPSGGRCIAHRLLKPAFKETGP